MLELYKGKRVLVTGHTGFKGSWLCTILKMAGADVIGYALENQETPSLYQLAQVADGITSVMGDVRDLPCMQNVFRQYQPEYVFHLAAQPLVLESYMNPVYTYETNVMGTVNVMECVRMTTSVKSVLNVTTDKVYANKEAERGYRENEPLNGYDPYSNSKSCSELVTNSYKKSFWGAQDAPKVSTVRAGNVIGGGDFAKNRVVPDCVCAAIEKTQILIRNPYSIRPFQHVLEALFVYLMIAEQQITMPELEGSYNVGPDETDCITTGKLADIFCKEWGENMEWRSQAVITPHEAMYLKLDCSKLKNTFDWKTRWNIQTAIKKTVEWTKAYLKGEDMHIVTEEQIREYFQ